MNTSNNWIVFGLGNLIFDIIDAIKSNGHNLEMIVLNQPVENQQLLQKIAGQVKIVNIGEFTPKIDTQNIFGFLDPDKRSLVSQLEAKEVVFTNLIHSRAYISAGSSIGVGNYFGPGSIVAPDTKIGNFNYFNRNSSIGHSSSVGNFNHFGPAATICGRTQIGDANMFGAGSTIIDGIKVADNISTGAGSTVVADLSETGLYLGTPAKKRD